MQILLIATDENVKLEPVAKQSAAPLLPVVNRPTMAIMVELLARAGYKKLLVSLHQRGGSIVSYFGAGRRWGVQIDYVMQRDAWGDAGALRWAGQLVQETVLVIPADIILDLDIDAALAAHRASGGSLTLITALGAEAQLVRPVAFTREGQVLPCNTLEPDALKAEFTGAFICEPHLLEHIPARTVYDSFDQLVPTVLAAGEKIFAYQTNAYWNPLNTFARYAEAQQVFLYSAYTPETPLPADIAALPKVRFPSIEGNQIAPGIWVGLNHIIHPTARLAAPLCIGEGCRIGYNVELGPEVVVDASVIIDDEATVRHSTILKRTYVGKLVDVNHRVIQHSRMIDTNTAECVDVVDKFLLSNIELPSISTARLLRVMDVLGALALIVLLLPVLLILLLVVAVVTRGNIFSRTLCIGRRPFSQNSADEPKPFHLLAFRVRRADHTWYPLGATIHYWGLDRLPELWNVIRGEMVLVGVRPLSTAEHTYLQETWHQKRREYPAGFTGLWYVQMPRPVTLDDILIADAYYIATRSWRIDMGILARTPLVWLQRRIHKHSELKDTQEYYRRVDEVSGI